MKGMNSQVQRPMEKKHVSGGLKFVVGEEQRAQALEAAAAWKKRFAEEAKWKQAVAKVKRFSQEDHVRLLGEQHPAPIAPAGRTRHSSSLLTPTAHHAAHRLRPAHIPRIDTVAAGYLNPSTPRACWDPLSPGPATTQTPSSVGNSFAAGGFWDKLTPDPVTPVPPTPITAIAAEPWSPIVPKDPEAKAAYDEVKKDVDSMALRLCASRLSIHTTLSSGSDYIPRSMVKPKDELLAAQLNVESRQIKLSKLLDFDKLPQKIEHYAEEETVAQRQYSINTTGELLDIDTWLQVDEKTLGMTILLDAQRELLRMSRNRRKSNDLKLSDQQLHLAWATKILDDTEYMIDIKGDDSSTYSDEDQGYDYSNFLRSIKREFSATSDLTSIPENGEVGSLRSSIGTDVTGATRSREASLSLRSNTSPKKPLSFLISRSREASLSNTESPCGSKLNSNAIGGPGLSISTHIKSDAQIDRPELTPEEKGSRRQGPSFSDLTNWANELKQMEDRGNELRYARENEVSHGMNHRRHTTFASSNHIQGEGSMNEAFSWGNEIAAKRKKEISGRSHVSPEERELERGPETPTPTSPSRSSVVRSKSFYARERLTGLIPLPPPSPAYNRYALTSSERISTMPSHLLASPFPDTPTLSPQHNNAVSHSQYLRSQTNISAARSDSQDREEEVDDWAKELKRMESREKIRQMGERERVGRSVEGG